MIRLPSLQKDFDVILSTDDAVNAPDAKDKKAAKKFQGDLERAWDTGDWSPLLIEGKQPVKFVCRMVPRDLLNKIEDRVHATNPDFAIGVREALSLAVRIGLQEVTNLGPDALRLDWERHATWGRLLKADILDQLGEENVAELGGVILKRSRPDPKS